MASSIFSFRERGMLIFSLAAIAILFGAAMNNAIPDPEHHNVRASELFWQHKVHELPTHAYNIIASGDSRVYRGFSPEIIEQKLNGAKALNYGFSGGGHNAFIFRQLEKLLANTGIRVIILGISPYSLTPKAQLNGVYNDYFRKGPAHWGDPVNDFFRAIDKERLKTFVRRQNDMSNERYEYLQNGYVRSDWAARNPRSELNVFATDFDGNTVDQNVIAGIFDQTRKWTAQGIIVLAYRPPTTPDMEAVEAAHSGFNEKAFAAEFRKAGGLWVDPGADFVSYDGSHLTPESADKLSEILAHAIAGRLKSP